MKPFAASLVLFAFLAGCMTQTQQTKSYKTLYSLEAGTTAAYDGYCDSVIKGISRTNEVPKISHAYNNFQASVIPALDAVQWNTNALAPLALAQEAADVVNLINTVKGVK